MSRSVKGLMIKDFKVMKSQMKVFFIIMIPWGIIMTVITNMAIFVGYVAMLCTFSTISTFNYDEFENGSAYLMTQPVSRKDYIVAKYLFGLLLTAVPFAVTSMIAWTLLVVRGTELSFSDYLFSISLLLPVAYLLLALEIPLQVKFGTEKGRMIRILLIVSIGAGFGMISYLNELAGGSGMEVISSIGGLGTGVLVLLIVAVIAVLMYISCKIACRIMEKKEF